MNRTPTGIKGFDKLVEGGFPEGAAILLSGTPGTGKTLFGLEFLYHGATNYNEPGLLVTLSDTRENLLKAAESFTWDFKKYLDKTIFIETLPSEDFLTTTQIIQKVEQHVEKHKIKRLVIDSLSTLIGMKRQGEATDVFVQSLFLKLLRKPHLTKLLITETPEERQLSSDGRSEFFCEGIVRFIYRSMSGEYNSDILIRKMRYTKHSNEVFPLEITKKGLVVRSA
ncbi:MAG: ATPase domain-containing protein [Nanoarchaeota archaeon]